MSDGCVSDCAACVCFHNLVKHPALFDAWYKSSSPEHCLLSFEQTLSHAQMEWGSSSNNPRHCFLLQVAPSQDTRAHPVFLTVLAAITSPSREWKIADGAHLVDIQGRTPPLQCLSAQPPMYLLNVKQQNSSFPAADGSQNGTSGLQQWGRPLSWMDEHPGHSL